MQLMASTYFPLFLIMAIGLIIGKLKFKGISLDISAVVFVALIFGVFGVHIDEIFQKIGLVLFVFSVGIQSGSGFVDSFRRNGARMILPVVMIVVLSAGLMILLSRVFKIQPDLALGLFTGARSSNSALAVGVESTVSKLPSLGHSIAYPLGVLGAVFFVRFIPFIFRTDAKTAEKEYLAQMQTEHPSLLTRTYIVENPNLVGKTFESLHFSRFTGVNVSRIMHNGEILIPQPHMLLAKGDLIKAVGLQDDLEMVKIFIGPETTTPDFGEIPLDLKHEADWVTVTNKNVINKSLGEIRLIENFSATVTRLKRNEVELSPHSWTTLRYGDRIMVVCRKTAIKEVKNFIGDGRTIVEADFLAISLVIAIGLVLGSIVVPLGGTFSLSLGMTGGTLIAALVLSSIGKTGPILWQISESSTNFVRQLGLLFFLSAVGTDAGQHLVPILRTNGFPVLISAVLLSLVPLILVSLFCRFVLKMNILTLMGLIAGGTTCSPALAVTSSMSTSNASRIAYATVFPFAMILMMLCTEVLAYFM